MGILDLHLDDVPDLSAVPEGEYRLRVEQAEVRTSQNTGGDYIYLSFGIVDEPDSFNVSHVLMLPTDKDDDKTRSSRLRRIKQFVEAVGLDPAQPFEVEDLIGLECFAILREEEDEEYGVRNRIRRFVKQ